MGPALVTVLIPVFNGGAYLRSAILSIMAQDYPSLEILIIDDGSTDGSTEVLRALAAEDARIRLIARENRGLVKTLNEGIEAASGAYIARMDADDVAYPDRISQQLRMFADNAELGLNGIAVDYLYSSDRLFRGRFEDQTSRQIKVRMLFDPFFYHPAVMYNLNVIPRKELHYDPAYIYNEDYDLFRRIANVYEVGFLNRSGLAWRQGHNSVSRRHIKEQSRMHLQIVGEQLLSAGIAGNANVLNDAVDRWALGETEDRGNLVRVLEAVRAYEGFRGEDHDAYEGGFQTLFIPLVRQMTQLASLKRVLETLEPAGLFGKMPWKMRLERRISAVVGHSAAEAAVRSLAATTRRLRSHSMKRTVKLPPVVVAALP